MEKEMNNKIFGMDNTFCTELIVSNCKRRGNGKDAPIRIIRQVFTKDGSLVAEHDPHPVIKELDWDIDKLTSFVQDELYKPMSRECYKRLIEWFKNNSIQNNE